MGSNHVLPRGGHTFASRFSHRAKDTSFKSQARRQTRHFAFSAAHVTLPGEEDDVWNQIDASLPAANSNFDTDGLAHDLNDLLDDPNDSTYANSPSENEVTAIRSLRDALHIATARMETLRDSFSRNSPNSRVRFSDRTTSHANETQDLPSPISAENSDGAPHDEDPFGFARNNNVDARQASHLNSGNNTTGLSSLSVSSSDLFKKLSKSAYTFDVEKLKYDANPRTRRDEFLIWVDTIKEVTQTNELTDNLLDGFPPRVPENVSPMVNRVMAQFLKAYLDKDIKPFLSTINIKNGMDILMMLQNMFEPISPADFTRAKNEFFRLTMYRYETVSSFIPRFHRKLKDMNSLALSKASIPSNFDVILSFLDRLEKGITNPDQRVLLLNYRRTCQKCDPSEEPFSLTKMQLALTELEARVECNLCGASDHTAKNCHTRRVKHKTKQIAYQA